MYIFIVYVHSKTSLSDNDPFSDCEPAAIFKQSRRKIFFQENGDAELDCVAKGNQTLKYTWLKDGQELDTDAEERLNIKSGIGTLVVSPAIESDAGVYQCKVINPCGTSLSHKINLIFSFIDTFTQKTEAEKKTVMMGKPLKLSCSPPRSVPEATIRWILAKDKDDYDGMEYTANEEEDEAGMEMFNSVELGRRITMDYVGNLYFVYVKKEDEEGGHPYICMAVNTEVRSLNQGDDKIIDVFGSTSYDDPVQLMWRSDPEVLALEGGKARFKCIFSGYPLPTVNWRRTDGGRLDEDRMKQSSDMHEFVINDVMPEDAGEYGCSGQNTAHGEVYRSTFTLKVESFPRWKKRPQDLRVAVDDNVTVTCRASGNPEPTTQWYINGLPIEEAPPVSYRRVHNNDLVFTKMSQDDSQVIQCNASNAHGYQWADVYVQVEAMEPTILSKPTEQKVAEDRNIIIPCGVEGKPKPEVRWYKGNQRLLADRYNILPNGDLEIKSVNPRDSDNYRCIAHNRFGEAEAEGSLVVRKKTEINSKPEDEKVNHGENVIFTCGAVTDEEELNRLRYVWLKDGKEVDMSDPRVRIVRGKLIINATSSKDTGEYTCVATNDLDRDEAKATLEVKAPPDPPFNVTVGSCGDTIVHLLWEFNDEQSNFSPLQEFIVEYNTNHNPDLWQEAKRVSAQERQANYPMLPWALYSFRARAKNLMGVSEPSEQTHPRCQSAESRPYRNPSGVETVGDKTGWLVIEWEPMPKTEHNSKDFLYEVSWQGEGDSEPQKKKITKWDQGRHEVKVDGVYKPYTVTVKAYNSLGQSVKEPKSVPGYSGEAPPNVVPQNFELDPNDTVTATSAAFIWDPVDTSPQNMNGEFQGYKIRYWKKDQMDTTLHEELIIIPKNSGRLRRRSLPPDYYENKIRGKVSNLPSFSDLEADVVVVNSYFGSNGSNVVNLTTPEGTPTRVEYLEALFRGSAHFLLEWGPPIEANGILTGYELGYRKIEGLQVGDLVVHRDDLPPSQRRANIDGLDSSSLYRIYVAARTKIGPGQKYFIDVRTADDNSELAEPMITKVLPSNNGANISFSLANKDKGQRTASIYYLEYRKIGDHGWDRDNQGATDHFWLTLKELEPDTSYEVRVVSVPKKGKQKSSTEARFNTTGFRFKPYALALVMENGTQASGNQSSGHTLGGVKKGSILSAGWFIGMMIAIAILLLILIIVCIVKRNRGKEYKFPPEKDTVDDAPAHFNEMAKGDKNGINSSASFEHDPEKVPLDDEADSLEDYGDVDPTKFNEDGSFIGQYGDAKPDAPNPSAMSSIV
ncbi:hypothetical protein ACOMHN_045631 [Nucella lapillus]